MSLDIPTELVDLVFDGPPGPKSGRFVEAERQDGSSLKVGKWVERDDGYWVLRIEVIPPKDMRGISRCWRAFGWHVYMAGPCFDTYEEALAYRGSLDAEGVTWRSQR